MERLRDETKQLHQDTERGQFQSKLLGGHLPLGSYAESLLQLLLVHRVLESHLRRLRETPSAFKQVVSDHQFQEANLLRDLQHFGRKPDEATPLPATRSFINEIDAMADERPLALLGVQYVLEGSKNGGKYIAKALARVHNLADGKGLAYLDPYGDDQQARWNEFKMNMEAASLSDAEQDTVVDAAKTTFRAILRIHQELHDAAMSA